MLVEGIARTLRSIIFPMDDSNSCSCASCWNFHSRLATASHLL